MKQDSLDRLKSNIEFNLENYKSKDNSWIYKYLGEDPFIDYKRKFNKFRFEYEDINNSHTDVKNVKILHENLRDITPTEAADERLWVGLSHGVFWEYMYERWKDSKKTKARSIEIRYFYGAKSLRRSLFTNTISRLWWIGELVYTSEKKDKYYLLDIFSGDFVTRTHTLFSSNYTGSRKILHSLLKTIYEFEKNNAKLSRKEFNSVVRHVNLLAGSYLLDYIEEDEISEKIMVYLERLR